MDAIYMMTFSPLVWSLMKVGFTLLFALIVQGLFSRFYKKFLPKLQASSHIWDDTLLEALHFPVLGAIWLIGGYVIFEITHNAVVEVPHFTLALPLLKIGLLSFTVYFATCFARDVENRLAESHRLNKRIDVMTIRMIGKVYRIAVWSLAILVLLPTMGVPLSGVIAFGSAGGIAVAFASKDLVANLFGGFIIFLERPFAIGDWIRSPDRKIEGTVESIGWRQVKLRTFDQRPLYVPSSLFSSIIVENASRMRNRRITANVGVRYQDADQVTTITNEIEAYLRQSNEIDTNRTLFVCFSEFAPSSLNISIYTFTKTTGWVEYLQVQHRVFLKVLEIVKQNGASVAFPTKTVHIETGET